jgi:DNA-binding winged helix-turn-helix (wHTH) protein/TolB-like protein
MRQPLPSVFRIGPFRVEPRTGEIFGPHGPVRLHPRPMRVLVFLAERPGLLVSRETLLAEIWSREPVGDHALTHVISEIRHALRDQAHAPAIIQTLPKRGYRLLAPVSALPADEPPGPDGNTVGPGPASRGSAPGLWAELRRRRVVRVALAYVIFAWVATEVSATVFPIVLVPDWAITFVVVTLALGFPVSVALAWAFDIDAGRVRRAPRERPIVSPFRFVGTLASRALLLVLCTVVLTANLVSSGGAAWLGPEAAGSGPAPAAVVVEPFDAAGRIVTARALSHSLTEEVRLRLAAVPGMRVRSAGAPADLALNGLVNVVGGRVRVIVRLSDTRTGDQVWAAEAEGPIPDSPEAWRRLVDELAGQFQPTVELADYPVPLEHCPVVAAAPRRAGSA